MCDCSTGSDDIMYDDLLRLASVDGMDDLTYDDPNPECEIVGQGLTI